MPAGLLILEYSVVSVLVDLPIGGAAAGLVGAVRIAAPVVLAAAAAGWLLARAGATSPRASLPPWRPWPALAIQPLAFAATCLLAWALFAPGREAVTTAELAGWLVLAGLTALLALAGAVPLRWLAGWLAAHWGVPLAALLLGALAWRAALAAEGAWGLFSGATLGAAAALVRAFSGRVTFDPGERVLGLDDFEVIVAPICSGVDGAGLVVMFLATWLSLARGRLRLGRALLLLPLGALVALGANVLRIAALVWLGGSGHEELAYGGFHSKLGWILFLGLALGGVVLAERVPWLQRPDGTAVAAVRVPDSVGAYLGPLLAALAAALLTGLWSAGPFDPWYGARVVAAALALLASRRSLPSLRPVAREVLAPTLIGLATCALWLAWSSGDGSAVADGLARLSPAARGAWLLLRVAGAVLVVPVVEELAFRGFLLPWLVAPDFEAVPPRAWTAAAVALSSAAFGALHQDWVLGTLAGLAFAVAKLRRGRVVDAVVAHAACNAGLAAAALWGGRLDLWG